MNPKIIISTIILLVIAGGCTKKIRQAASPNLQDGKYDSEFSSGDLSVNLARSVASIRKIYSVDYYTTWHFNQSSRVTWQDISTGRYKKAALGTISTHETNSGTATLILNRDHRIALLTCAHILNSKDTIISTFSATAEDSYAYIKSFSVKDKQELYIKDLPQCGTFRVLALDRDNDLAIVGKYCDGNVDSVKAIAYPSGSSYELGWGSLVYILGYPMGNLMITRGIVSPVNNMSGRLFSVDALLNRGYSGGIIMAIRDGVPNFEIVGIVKSMSTHQNYYLKPEKEIHDFYYSSFIKYEEDVYVGTEELVNYGISFVVPIETITTFYKKNRTSLITQGFNLDHFFIQ